ncbi:unnamed protein product [Brassica oleracea]
MQQRNRASKRKKSTRCSNLKGSWGLHAASGGYGMQMLNMPASQDLGITLRATSFQKQDYLRQSLPVQQQLQLPNWTGERDMSSLRTR